MLSLEHKAVIENFYITLALHEFDKASPEVYGEMVLEVNNTKATLLSLLDSNYPDECTLINASTKFTYLLRFVFHDRMDLRHGSMYPMTSPYLRLTPHDSVTIPPCTISADCGVVLTDY